MKKALFVCPFLGAVLCLAAVKNYVKPTTAELHARIPSPAVEHCASEDGEPDSDCTPGKELTTNVKDICKGPSTTTIRPPSWYTNDLKEAQIVEYGYGDVSSGDYEEDHLIALEIGGHPDDPRNLWPQAHGGQFGSEQKDKVENWLHKQICSGAMTPREAQEGIKTDWRQYLKNLPPYKPRKVREVQ
jgi:hypothetical protein